ncbi:MAG TPA: YceI family protein [Polyangiaceae bacterium]|nr:YceI family protein [Polyangiaceae bacterium]
MTASSIARAAIAVTITGFMVGCKTTGHEPTVEKDAPSPAASAVASSAAGGALHFAVDEKGAGTFVIDAPLEKIKGHVTHFRGAVDVNPEDLEKTTGEIDADLDSLVTETFEDASRNAAQTGHAHNWLELGSDVEQMARDSNRWMKLTVQSLAVAGSTRLADVAETGGARTVHAVVHGQLWLHGVSTATTVTSTATFTVRQDGVTVLHIVTDAPLVLSLHDHDVKPRDIAGRFLSGALERVGKKIDDHVDVTADLTATSGPERVAR